MLSIVELVTEIVFNERQFVMFLLSSRWKIVYYDNA